MRKIVSGFFIATLLLATQACANAPGGQSTAKYADMPFGYLAEWEGTVPEAVPANKEFDLPAHGNLWDNPEIKAELEKVLGKVRFQQMISGWGAGYIISPGIEVLKDGNGSDFIGFFACKPHDCLAHGATVFVRLSDGAVQACWVEESEKSKGLTNNFVSDETWLSPAGERKLAEGECTGDDKSLERLFKRQGGQLNGQNKKVN